MLAETLPTLTEAEAFSIWISLACVPNPDDRFNSFKNCIFSDLGLDYRNPVHAEHVAKIAAPHEPRGQFKRTTND